MRRGRTWGKAPAIGAEHAGRQGRNQGAWLLGRGQQKNRPRFLEGGFDEAMPRMRRNR
jgi:hypothetical protein